MTGARYGFLDRLLHWISLEPHSVRALSFELERHVSLPARTPKDPAASLARVDKASGPVYVCGLARSGTTILLRVLNELNIFSSITYRDMPFVLAPNLWGRLQGRTPCGSTRCGSTPCGSTRCGSTPCGSTRCGSTRAVGAAMRPHGDGLLVDLDSPESFEEVFWRTFSVASKNAAVLGPDVLLPEAWGAFADYRALTLRPRHRDRSEAPRPRRYLSKNNNNLMRLAELASDPAATVLITYRPPLETARSLLRLHRHFSRLQIEDGFVRKYMAWLGHHEFGLDHRPFWFAASSLSGRYARDDINYWLEYWVGVHRHIMGQTEVDFRLVSHAALRAAPQDMLGAIMRHLEVKADIGELARQIKPPNPDTTPNADVGADVDLRVLTQAEKIYDELTASAKNILPRIGLPQSHWTVPNPRVAQQ